MIDLLRWALQRQERSKETARKRLQFILVLDRIGLTQENIEAIKSDMIQVVSKYLVVEEGGIEVDMKRSGESMVLVSNVQVKEVVRNFAPQQPVPST